MADIYVRSDGSNTSPYDTWAKAATTFGAAVAVEAAGDNIWVDSAFAESSAGSKVYDLSSTANNPTKVLVVDSTGDPEPPVASDLTSGASITSTDGAVQFESSGYIYGLEWSGFSGVNLGAHTQGTYFDITAENCVMYCNRAAATTPVTSFGKGDGSSTGRVLFKDSKLDFASSQGCYFYCGFVHFNNVSARSGSTTPDALFEAIGTTVRSGVRVLVENSDFTNWGTGFDLLKICSAGDVIFRNSKLPTSWAGNWVVTRRAGIGWRFVANNISAGSTVYHTYILDGSGTITDETTIVPNSSVADVVWNMTTTAEANEINSPLISEEFHQYNDTTGSAITVTVEFIHDSVTALQDDEIWLEVSYHATSGSSQGTSIDDKRANLLTTPADQTTSAKVWTTTGLTNPNEQKLSVTFTPNAAGYLHARVYLGKPSYTVYVEPIMTIS